MNQEVDKLHGDFLKTLYKVVYLAKIHQVNNPLLIECINDFKKVAGCLLVDDDHITLQVSRGNVFIQAEKLLSRREIAKLVKNTIEYFEKRNIQGLCFYTGVQEVSDNEIIEFCRTLNESEQHEDPLNWFVEQMKSREFKWV